MRLCVCVCVLTPLCVRVPCNTSAHRAPLCVLFELKLISGLLLLSLRNTILDPRPRVTFCEKNIAFFLRIFRIFEFFKDFYNVNIPRGTSSVYTRLFLSDCKKNQVSSFRRYGVRSSFVTHTFYKNTR